LLQVLNERNVATARESDALAAAAIVAVPTVREQVLRAAGWALIVNEPLAPADIIVIVPGLGGAGALEAADLVQSGIATRVAVFCRPSEWRRPRVHPDSLTKMWLQGRLTN
jgi:hypothetical protein